MRARLFCVGLLALGLSSGCASAPPPAPAPAPAPPAPPPPAPVVAATPDLSPVSEPKNLVGLGRWRNVSGTLRALERMARLPVSLQGLAEKEIGDPEVASALKLDSSVDVAVALDPAATEPDFFIAFSIPLKNLEEAKGIAERDGRVTQLRPGIYRIGKPRKSNDVTCDLAVSLGDAPARLVCGQRDRDLDALLPWLTRGMPTVDLGSNDMHVELRFGPVQERFRPLLQQGAAQASSLASLFMTREFGISDPAILDAVGGSASEAVKLADDLDVFTADTVADADKSLLSFKTAIKFHGSTSWFTKALTTRNDRAGAAPAIFFQAPKDSETAVYGRGGDPALWDGIRHAIPALFSAVARGKVPDADRKAIEDVLAKIPMVDAVTVSASGHAESKNPPKPAKPAERNKDGSEKDFPPAELMRELKEQFSGTLGWTVAGYDAKIDDFDKFLRELVAVYNRPSLQTLLKKELRGKAASFVPTVRIVAAPPGFPRGSMALEGSATVDSETLWEYSQRTHFRPHPKTPAVKQTFSLMLVVVPDGNRTWIAFGADPKVLKEKIDAVKTGSAQTGTLASRDGLDTLKIGPNTMGGFFSLTGAIASLHRTTKRMMSDRESRMIEGAIASMPNKGQSPILILGTGTGGATPSSALEIRAQKGTVDDLAALISYGIAMAMQKRSEMSSDMPPPMPPMPSGPPETKATPAKKK